VQRRTAADYLLVSDGSFSERQIPSREALLAHEWGAGSRRIVIDTATADDAVQTPVRLAASPPHGGMCAVVASLRNAVRQAAAEIRRRLREREVARTSASPTRGCDQRAELHAVSWRPC